MNNSYLPLSNRKAGPVPVRACLNQAGTCRWEQEDGVWVCRASLDRCMHPY